jgi:hypothetical protein
MLKRIAISSLALAAMLVGPTQPAAASIPIYRTAMYSDATHTVEVGYIWGECSWMGVQYHLVGTYTYFQEDTIMGYCGGGGGDPIE